MVLNKYGHLLKWSSDNQDTVMDVGCGPGNVLFNVILPVFQGKYSMAYGTDVSTDMIDFCQRNYAEQENLKFLVLDIEGCCDYFERKYGRLDHIVSTYALHWLTSQPKGFRNIYNLLKPGGDFLSLHIQSSTLYDIMAHMDQHHKWSQYFDHLADCIPLSQNSTRPEQELRDILINNGFEDVMVDVVYQDVVMDNYETMMAFLGGIVCQVERVPKEERMDYIQEFMDYGIGKGLIKTRSSGELSYPIYLYLAYGSKRE